MNYMEIVGLGVVQGLTEFLPVSSSGHLVAARVLFNWSDANGLAVDAWLHLGTLLAVLAYYWRVWLHLTLALAVKLTIATVPAALAGWWLVNSESAWLRSPTTTVVGLLITAAMLAAAERLTVPAGSEGGEQARPSRVEALIIGVAQVVALVPGISRLGTTLAAGLGLGLSRAAAGRFSFLLSAPIIAGAGLSGWSSLAQSGFSGEQLWLGLAASFLAGLAAIHIMLKILERMSLWPFVVYLLGLAGVIWYVA